MLATGRLRDRREARDPLNLAQLALERVAFSCSHTFVAYKAASAGSPLAPGPLAFPVDPRPCMERPAAPTISAGRVAWSMSSRPQPTRRRLTPRRMPAPNPPSPPSASRRWMLTPLKRAGSRSSGVEKADAERRCPACDQKWHPTEFRPRPPTCAMLAAGLGIAGGYFCVGLLALAMRPPSEATTREIAPAWVARRKESPAKAGLSLGRNRTVPHSCRPCGPSDETVTNTDVVCAM